MSVPLKLLPNLDFETLDKCEFHEIEEHRLALLRTIGEALKSKTNQIEEVIALTLDILRQRIVERQLKVNPQQLLAFRSSSTLEDLDKMAGAGLYDSVLNVSMNNI